MQIYTPVLKEVCKDLRSLTMHIGYDKECIRMGKMPGGSLDHSFPLTFADDASGDERKTDEEKLDRIVGRVVKGLSGLQHLQLGDYKKAPIPAQDLQWGKAARWGVLVKTRNEGENIREFFEIHDGLENGETPGGRGSSKHRGGRRGGRANFRGRGNIRGRGRSGGVRRA